MRFEFGPGFFFLVVVALGAFAVWSWQQDQKRLERLRLWALRRGWRAWPGGEGGPLYEHPGLSLLERGHSRRCDCLIRGRSGHESSGAPGEQALDLFDFRYVTGHGKNRQTHRYAVAILSLPFPVKSLRLRPENAFDKVGEFLGAEDIDFESAEFSRRFFVSANDRKWAYDIIHARMMEFLLAAPAGWSLEMGSREVAAFRPGRGEPAVYEEAIALLEGVRDRIPDYVIRSQRGED